MRWKEVTIYVHGITPEANVKSHSKLYRDLHNLINAELESLGKGHLGKPIMVEWGWGGASGASKRLADAEQKVASLAMDAIRKKFDFTINPLRLAANGVRSIFLAGVADMFYYVSKDGKESVRKAVFGKILKELGNAKETGEGISLTCIGHSAGTVILHDLLYNIFAAQYNKTPSPAYKYVSKALMDRARRFAKAGQIRLRRFYTFGSPITPLVFRSNRMISKIMKKEKGFLDPRDIGLIGMGSRWVNFWDKDDLISYPVECIYDNKLGLIEDRNIDVSDFLSEAHNAYWASRKMARYIAKTY